MNENNLTGLLETQKELMLQILGIDKQIKGLITEESLDELNMKLQDRQEIIGQVEQAALQIKKIDPQNLQEQHLRKQIGKIVSDIKTVDMQNKALGQNTVNKYREQIRKLNHVKKSMGSYTGTDKKSNGVFVDAKK